MLDQTAGVLTLPESIHRDESNVETIASLICDRLQRETAAVRAQFNAHGQLQTAVIDDLLPVALAEQLRASFPPAIDLVHHKSIREDKYVGFEMDRYAPVVGQATYAFQQPAVIETVAACTGLADLRPDPHLYLGGISLMGKGQFLNPHIDNSHDQTQELYRVLNLLYYVSPEWQPGFGGGLELWDHGHRDPRVITPQFNRLVIMATHRRSWHSVQPIVADRQRLCVSNYYFSRVAIDKRHGSHGTCFRGRPGQPLRTLVLQMEAALKQLFRRVRGRGRPDRRHVRT